MVRTLLCALACILCCTSAARAQAAPSEAPTLEFIENLGQWPSSVAYTADIMGGRLFVEPNGLTYSFLEAIPHGKKADQHASAATVKAHGVRVTFEGGAPQPGLHPTDQTGEVRNYLRGNDPRHWAHDVRSFRQLQYGNIWPGIQAHFYENKRQQLEYDFELAAQADPALIRLHYQGAQSVVLNKTGELEISTSVGILRELPPQAWQTDAAGQRQHVACAYQLDGTTVRFRLGAYDHERPLVIDPTVVFSTYSGSTAENWGFTATYDQQGNMYSGGIVYGAGYPTTLGAFRTTFAGVTDIGIIKYNTATSGPAARVWATYLGGSQGDFPHSLIVSSQGDVYMLGSTSSTDYPTSATAYDRTFNGGTSLDPFGYGGSYQVATGSDIVVTHLSANGGSLVGSTYLGGSSNDGLLPSGLSSLVRNYGDAFRGDILLDADNNIYIASNTSSANFPTANGLGGVYRGGSHDAVVCKLNSTASTLLWSSFLGGSGSEAAYSLQFDATGNIYVSGGTTSTNFPTTAGALHTTARGDTDGYVARISSTGETIQTATYLGTSAYDQSYFLQLDGSGAVYVLGQSLGSYPVTPGRYQNAGSKQFIHKLDANLATTGFSTVFGSGRNSIDISPTAFLVDQCNRIFVSGWGGGENQEIHANGTTHNLSITPNAVQRTTDGQDFYLLQLTPDAGSLGYATYFGQTGSFGDHVDGGTSRFDPRGMVYQAVCSCSYFSSGSGFPVPPGAGTYSAVSGSPQTCNNVAFKFNFETANVVAGADRSVCVSAGPQALAGSPAGGVWSGPGVSGSVAAGFVFTPSTALLGPQRLTYAVSGVGPCGGLSSLQLTVTPSPPPAAFTAPTQTAFCLTGSSLPASTLAATPAGGTFAGPGVFNSTFNPNQAGPGVHTITYTVNVNGCTLSATQTMNVIRATVGPSFAVCTNAPAPVRLMGSPAGGTWSGPGVSGSVATGFVFTSSPALVGARVLTYSVNGPSGCVSTATLTATVYLAGEAVFTPPASLTYCSTTTTPVPLPAGAFWNGRAVYGNASSGYTFIPAYAGTGTFFLSYSTGYSLCDVSGAVPVTVVAPVALTLPPDTVICPGSTQPFRLRGAPAGGSWSGPNISSAGLFTPPAGLSGSVTLTYTTNTGPCVSSGTRRVVVATPPLYAATWKVELCAEARQAPLTVHFSDPLNSLSGVRWDFGDGTQGTGNTITHVYTQPNLYKPRIIRPYNNERCTVELDLPAIEVRKAYPIPNIITPNGDNINDVFLATNGCPGNLQVFSRWGNKIFEATSYRNDWNGGQAPSGTYYYHLRQADGVVIKGWLEINR